MKGKALWSALTISWFFTIQPASALRQGDIKIVKTWAYNRVQTYDLSADLSETRSRSKGMPEKTEQLHQLLMDYLKRVDAIEPPEAELAIDRTGILMKKSAP